MTRRNVFWGVGIGCAGLMMGLLALEIAVRLLSTVEGRWELRSFLADDGDTQRRWHLMRPDKLLGYAPRSLAGGVASDAGQIVTFDEAGLRLTPRPLRANRLAPVLMVGDGQVMGEGVGDDATLPAHLAMRLQRVVLNGGVTGYGIDQTVLRGERLARAAAAREVMAAEVMVVGLTADTVRRAEMSILWGVAKPYFQRVGGGLQLRNVPVPSTINDLMPLDSLRRTLAHSLLLDLALRNSSLSDWWLAGQPGHAQRIHETGTAVACLLMERLRRFGRDSKMGILIVGQYTADAWTDEATLAAETNIVGRVLACARMARLDVLDTRASFAVAVRRDGVSRYYAGGYASEAGNRLAADLIAEHLGPPEISSPPVSTPKVSTATGG